MGGAFSEELARYYFKNILDGMEHIHKKGVVHRDLKIENILLDKDFNLKITDFGFAAPIKGWDESGLLSTSLGTPSYLAPEVFAKAYYFGDKVDVFAAGVILYVLMVGSYPFGMAKSNDPFYRSISSNR